jgi:endonuclease G
LWGHAASGAGLVIYVGRGVERSVSGRKRAKTKGGGFRALVASALGAVVLLAAAIACRPDLWLEGAGSQDDSPSPGGSAGPAGSTRRPSPKKSPSATTSKAPSGGAPSNEHLAMGTPVDGDASDDYLMTKPQYALSYNKEKNIPNWVSYSLNASHFGDVPRFKGKFLADEALPPGFYRVRHEDYVGSGYDRGHMVRSEERTKTPEDNKATFLLTNVLPQYHDLNAGPWLRLEEHAQDLAQKEKRQLYVITGGIFAKKPETIGKGVAVPTACFKVIVVVGKGEDARHVTEETPVIAVVMPNKEGIMSRGWEEYRTSVDEIEKRTGYELLSRVAEDVQNVIESRAD